MRPLYERAVAPPEGRKGTGYSRALRHRSRLCRVRAPIGVARDPPGQHETFARDCFNCSRNDIRLSRPLFADTCITTAKSIRPGVVCS